MSAAKWIPHHKGGPGEYFEVAVIREDNTHGLVSYGWFGEDKLFVSGSGGPCCLMVGPEIWQKLLDIAATTAALLNESEGK